MTWRPDGRPMIDADIGPSVGRGRNYSHRDAKLPAWRLQVIVPHGLGPTAGHGRFMRASARGTESR